MIPLVLVHGAYHGAWCWEHVAPILHGRGVDVRTVELPLSGFDEDVRHLRRIVTELGNVVICGHSYGGRVVSAAVDEVDSVRGLIYLAALMLDSEEARAYLAQRNQSRPRGFEEFDFPYVYDRFYRDCERDVAQQAHARLRPMRVEEVTVDGFGHHPWETIPSTYIVCGRDRAIAPDFQRRIARKADRVVEIDSDHSPFLSRPEDLAAVLFGEVKRHRLDTGGL